MKSKELYIIKKLFEIIDKNECLVIHGQDREVLNIYSNSKNVTQNSMFCAVKGDRFNGHDYISEAINMGASVILCESAPTHKVGGVTYIVVRNVAVILPLVLQRFYLPEKPNFKLIGITGTNGKTTVSTLLYDLFVRQKLICGLISTIRIVIDSEEIGASMTTPDIVRLYQILALMHHKKCEYVFMEVSSHAIVQERIKGLVFDVAVFTNISHDHLDYHGSFSNYIKAKKLFFDNLAKDSKSITNVDDTNGMVMVQNTKSQVVTYGLNKMADIKAKIISSDIVGTCIHLNGAEVYTRLVGKFNVYNISAVYAVAICLELDEMEVLRGLSSLKAPTGRFEVVSHSQVYGIIDYAHTPDALQNVLSVIRDIHRKGRVITVVGCGGDRDKSKRSIMGQIAVRKSDKVVFTSDNPRGENPDGIVVDMMTDLDAEQERKTLIIIDRKQAIKAAFAMASEGDLVLVAGKGHENYQEINGVKYPFNDAEVVRNVLTL